MSISVNGQSQVPPGFRFHPTEEELLQYYLKKKVVSEKIDLDVIKDVDLNKLEPWDIQEKCRIGTTPQNDWYFFSHKDKKYPTGTRTNRATCSGFWKATGRDKVIYGNSTRIGMRKTLVFYKGRAPHGQKSDWIMHEYRLDDNATPNNITAASVCNGAGEGGQEEGWVVCRVFKKKSLGHKASDCSPIGATWPSPSSMSTMNSCNEASLEEMLQSMGTPSRRDFDTDNNNNNNNNDNNNSCNRRYMKLPGLYNSSCRTQTNYYQPLNLQMLGGDEIAADFPTFLSQPPDAIGIQDWAALDRLVASHLSDAPSKPLHAALSHDSAGSRMTFGCPDDPLLHLQQRSSSSSSSRRYGVAATAATNDYQNDGDLWSFAPTCNDQLCDVSAVHPI